MAQRRKVEMNVVDESDKGLQVIFRNTANEISQLYALSVTHQQLAFDAGHRHALEKVNEWIRSKLQEGKLVTVADIFAYLEDELNNIVPIPELNKIVPIHQLQEPSGSGSHHSSASANARMEGQEKDYASGSQELEMEISSGNPI